MDIHRQIHHILKQQALQLGKELVSCLESTAQQRGHTFYVSNEPEQNVILSQNRMPHSNGCPDRINMSWSPQPHTEYKARTKGQEHIQVTCCSTTTQNKGKLQPSCWSRISTMNQQSKNTIAFHQQHYNGKSMGSRVRSWSAQLATMPEK